MTKKIRYTITLFVSLLAISLACIVFNVFNINKSTIPPDSRLIGLFYSRHQIFYNLQHLAEEDARRKMFYSEQCLTNNFGKLRCNKYNQLIGEIDGGHASLSVDYDGSLSFSLAGSGSQLSPGWSKGIIYLPGDPTHEGVLLKSLDGAERLPPNIYLREVERHWYLIYQRDVD
jgi:hypothetical protein